MRSLRDLQITHLEALGSAAAQMLAYPLRKLWLRRCDSFRLSLRAEFRYPRYIDIGHHVVIEEHCLLSAWSRTRDGGITVGDSSHIFCWAQLQAQGGHIRIGCNCTVNTMCLLTGDGGLNIGDGVHIGAQTCIITSSHSFQNTDIPIYLQGGTSQGVTIQDDVWIGAGVQILDGVHIGCGTVIGAGAVVTESIPPYSIAVGVPARVVKNRTDAT
jgi:acetyltransferase-like isoleucine patch superfamily enzyme